MQVANPPETQDVCPCVQLSLQVREHEALAAIPEQDFGIVHVEVDAT
ncbi:MAG TPA: hypothetical protein VGY54_03805 [Polyangiaceae bacterium]|nr:hypothetical protein [Polyangiaceae bacterium]